MTTQTQPELTAETPPAKSALSLRAFMPGQWLVYLIIMTAGTVLMLVLPSPFPLLLLVGLTLFALVVAARDAGLSAESVRGDWDALRENAARAAEDTANISRARWIFVAASAAVVLMTLAAMAFRPSPMETPLDVPVILMLLGGAALGVAVKVAPHADLMRYPALGMIAPPRARIGVVIPGVLLLAFVAEVSGMWTGTVTPVQVSIHAQFALWLLGVALTTWGMAGAPGLALLQTPLAAIREPFARVERTTALAVLGLFALAFALRVWGVGDTLRVPVDETDFYAVVIDIESQPARALLQPTRGIFLASPAIYSYGQYALVQIFGHDFAGLRLLSVIVGALTVPALYLLASTLFDRKTALVAAFLLATFPPHLHFSRLALYHVADALFGTLALAFLARGLKHNRRADWALAGMALGLTQYFFEAGRLFFVPLVVLWVIVLALVFGRELQAHWQGLMVAALTALFIAAPVYYTIFAQGEALATRLSTSGLGADDWSTLLANGMNLDVLQTLLKRFGAPFEMYVHQPEIRDYIFYYGGSHAMVLEFLVPLFLLGVFFVLWHWRAPSIVLILWIAGVALGNGLLRHPHAYPRWVVVFPAVALLMAVGLRYLVPLLWHPRAKTPVALPLAALAVAVGMAQATYYFNVHLIEYNRQYYAQSDAPYGYDAILRAHALPFSENVQVVFISDPIIDRGLHALFERYVRGEMVDEMYMRVAHPADITPDWLLALPRDRRYAFFIERGDAQTQTMIASAFWVDPPVGSPYGDYIPDDKEFQMVFAHDRR